MFCWPIKSLIFGIGSSEIGMCKCLVTNLTNRSNFHPLEVVGRGSETQLTLSV